MPTPAANLIDRIELMAFDILGEVAQLIDTIANGKGPSGVFEIALPRRAALAPKPVKPGVSRRGASVTAAPVERGAFGPAR